MSRPVRRVALSLLPGILLGGCRRLNEMSNLEAFLVVLPGLLLVGAIVGAIVFAIGYLAGLPFKGAKPQAVEEKDKQVQPLVGSTPRGESILAQGPVTDRHFGMTFYYVTLTDRRAICSELARVSGWTVVVAGWGFGMPYFQSVLKLVAQQGDEMKGMSLDELVHKFPKSIVVPLTDPKAVRVERSIWTGSRLVIGEKAILPLTEKGFVEEFKKVPQEHFGQHD